MKKIIFTIIFFLTFIFTIDLVLSDCTPSNPCCCQEYPGGQKKCFTSGICCLGGIEEYWDPYSCFNFKLWVEPARGMFTVGRKTRVNLYIENIGAFADNYDITYSSPAQILVDMSGVSPVNNVARGEIRIVYPMISVLSTTATGDVFFNATSQGDQGIYRNATLTVLPSDLPVSLPESNLLGMIMLIILSAVVYSAIKRKNR